MRVELPTGIVTFLFTDVESSTRLIDELGEKRYAEVLAEHRRLLREAFAVHGGIEVDTQGDAFLYVFASANAALTAGADGQQALASVPVRVRMGLHTGEPLLTAEGYVGRELHRAARVAAAGHGGQVLVSATTAALVDGELRDLGKHRLKDFDKPIGISQFGRVRFPPLRTISNTNLPRPASSFVGRAREREEVLALLRNGARLVTLAGPGGSGKTRLAVEVASELVPAFKEGVFWVGLATLGDPGLVAQTIEQTLGARDGLAAHVSDRELLLLLDNFEQVVEAAPYLAEVLEICPNLRVLVTSRELLRVSGEVDYPVPPLAEPEAVELFCQRSRLEPDATIAELCRRLDDLPLAVELAAARSRVLAPAQILDRLGRRLDLLKGGRDANPRQQTLRATIEWSYGLLTGEEQHLFARLAVFSGGWTLDAAEDVSEAEVDLLQSLVDKSLLRHTGDRFWMLETIREYAAERLQNQPELREIFERHARWCLSLAKSAQGELRGAAGKEWLGRLDADLENLRRAIAWVRDEDERSEVELVGATWYFLNVRGLFREALGYLLHALETARSASLAQEELLYGAGCVASGLGDFAAAQKWWGELLELGRAGGEVGWIAKALAMLGVAAFESGEPERSHALFLDAAGAARECGDMLPLTTALHGLSEIALAKGDTETARRHSQHELEVARELHNPRGEANALISLSLAALLEGAIEDAARDLTTALRLHSGLRDSNGTLEGLLGFAEVATRQADMVRAARLLAAADALREETGHSLISTAQKQRERVAAAVASDDTLTAVTSEGRAMTLDEAIAYALGE